MAYVPWRLIFCCLLGLCALYFLGWALLAPGKPLRRLALNAARGVGGALLWNLGAAALGAGIQVNLALAVLSAAFGLPGAALAGVLQRVLA